MGTSYLDFGLNVVDMAYAITQQQLNEALADYFINEQISLDFAFDIDDEGNPIPPKNPNDPQVTFQGTVAVPKDSEGHHMDIVDMSSPGANNSVIFTLGFKQGVFVDNNLNVAYKQADFPGETWSVSFSVSLQQQDNVDPSSASPSVGAIMATINENFDNAFSLSQILVDLSTAVYPGLSPVPQGFLRYAWDDFTACLTSTLLNRGNVIFANPMVAGYAAVQTGAAETPNFTPTDVEITLLGNSQDAAASLLVFAMSTSGALPANWQDDFSGTTLVSDPDATPGVAFVRADLFTPFVQNQIAESQYANTVNQCVNVSYNGENFTYNLEPAPGVTPNFSATPPTTSNNSQLGFVNMPQVETSNEQEGTFSETQDAFTQNSSSVNYQDLSGGGYFDTLVIQGNFALFVTDNTASGLSFSNWTSPTFNFAWYANYDFTVVADSGFGTPGLVFQINKTTSSFPGSFTSMDTSQESSWGTVPPSTQQLVSTALSPLTTNIPKSFANSLESVLNNMNLFVFPASGAFTFANPGTNSQYTLISTISYTNTGSKSRRQEAEDDRCESREGGV